MWPFPSLHFIFFRLVLMQLKWSVINAACSTNQWFHISPQLCWVHFGENAPRFSKNSSYLTKAPVLEKRITSKFEPVPQPPPDNRRSVLFFLPRFIEEAVPIQVAFCGIYWSPTDRSRSRSTSLSSCLGLSAAAAGITKPYLWQGDNGEEEQPSDNAVKPENIFLCSHPSQRHLKTGRRWQLVRNWNCLRHVRNAPTLTERH